MTTDFSSSLILFMAIHLPFKKIVSVEGSSKFEQLFFLNMNENVRGIWGPTGVCGELYITEPLVVLLALIPRRGILFVRPPLEGSCDCKICLYCVEII